MGLGPAAQARKQDLEGEGPVRLIGRPSNSGLRWTQGFLSLQSFSLCV